MGPEGIEQAMRELRLDAASAMDMASELIIRNPSEGFYSNAGALVLHRIRRIFPDVMNPRYDDLVATLWGIETSDPERYDALMYAAGVPSLRDPAGLAFARLNQEIVVQ